MDSDNVNSISDTIEATQVANLVHDVYFDMVSERDLGFNETLFQLTGSGDVNQPTKMQIPANISKVTVVRYDVVSVSGGVKQRKEIVYLDPRDFLELVDSRSDQASDNQEVVDTSGVLLNILNSVPPTYWTSFDDDYIVFDSFDNVVETTLQTSKTSCLGVKEPTLTIADATVPDLPQKYMSLLLAESKATSFAQLKGAIDPKSEQQARKIRIHLQNENRRIENASIDFSRTSYGRVPK